jgi:luciferase family oxidoreductase group 1
MHDSAARRRVFRTVSQRGTLGDLSTHMIPFSVLDLAPIVQGSDPSRAFQNSRDLAQHAERWGYARFWLAEHHGMPGIASAATSVVIGHIAEATSTIRVGAGGIMLPNHSPFVIAEQFGTLAALYPGRIDLGLGRAPGSDQVVARALRRDYTAADTFPQDVVELMSYFESPTPGQQLVAVPGAGSNVPVWILGSSLFGASLAAALGLPFAFASHFAPTHLFDALAVYRSQFQPSATLERPYVMLGVNVFAADTDSEAKLLFSSLQQAFVSLRRGRPRPLPPPVADFERELLPGEAALLNDMLRHTVIGSPETVRQGLTSFIEATGADELMITSQTFDHHARLHSFEITANLQSKAG